MSHVVACPKVYAIEPGPVDGDRLEHPQLDKVDSPLVVDPPVLLPMNVEKPDQKGDRSDPVSLNAPESLIVTSIAAPTYLSQQETTRPSQVSNTVASDISAPIEGERPVESFVDSPLAAPARSSDPAGDPELGILRLQDLHTAPDSAPTVDPELGVLRLQETVTEPEASVDPELGVLRLQERQASAEDPELGVLRLQEQQVEQSLEQPPAPPTVYLFAGANYFRSDNILLDNVDPIDDQLVSGYVTLSAFPALDANTLLVASVGTGMTLYDELSRLNYYDLNQRVGVRHFFLPRTYVEAAWTHQELFELNGGDRFLDDHSLRLTLARRDFLSSDLSLDSFYQLRFSFTSPVDRSRITNSLGLYVGYQMTPSLQAGLGYQLLLSSFTEERREDAYNQLLAQLSYDLSERVQVTLYGGVSFGASSNPNIDLDSTIFGASVDISVPLF